MGRASKDEEWKEREERLFRGKDGWSCSAGLTVGVQEEGRQAGYAFCLLACFLAWRAS